jgi:hypothetical protein
MEKKDERNPPFSCLPKGVTRRATIGETFKRPKTKTKPLRYMVVMGLIFDGDGILRKYDMLLLFVHERIEMTVEDFDKYIKNEVLVGWWME